MVHCQSFLFKDDQFKQLSAWPLYKGGYTEVPCGSIVLVVYTLGMYHGLSGPVLCSNLISVILLALA